jgi:hypothetical protein
MLIDLDCVKSLVSDQREVKLNPEVAEKLLLRENLLELFKSFETVTDSDRVIRPVCVTCDVSLPFCVPLKYNVLLKDLEALKRSEAAKTTERSNLFETVILTDRLSVRESEKVLELLILNDPKRKSLIEKPIVDGQTCSTNVHPVVPKTFVCFDKHTLNVIGRSPS